MKRWEKGIIGLVIAIALSFGVWVWADEWGRPTGVPQAPVAVSPEAGYVLLTANTSGFTGTPQDISFTATKHDCVITVGGTAPTSVTVSLYGSIDNSVFPTILTHTYTIATATTRSFSAWYARRYMKGSFDSKVGGDTTTTVTLKCVGTK